MTSQRGARRRAACGQDECPALGRALCCEDCGRLECGYRCETIPCPANAPDDDEGNQAAGVRRGGGLEEPLGPAGSAAAQLGLHAVATPTGWAAAPSCPVGSSSWPTGPLFAR